jgi:hypothetical protein
MSIRRSACVAAAGALAQMTAQAAPSAFKIGWKVKSAAPALSEPELTHLRFAT